LNVYIIDYFFYSWGERRLNGKIIIPGILWIMNHMNKYPATNWIK
jgi:hypothetical protein